MSLVLLCLRVNVFVNEKRPKRAPWRPEGTAMVVESEPRWTLLHSLLPTPRWEALMIQISRVSLHLLPCGSLPVAV